MEFQANLCPEDGISGYLCKICKHQHENMVLQPIRL